MKGRGGKRGEGKNEMGIRIRIQQRGQESTRWRIRESGGELNLSRIIPPTHTSYNRDSHILLLLLLLLLVLFYPFSFAAEKSETTFFDGYTYPILQLLHKCILLISDFQYIIIATIIPQTSNKQVEYLIDQVTYYHHYMSNINVCSLLSDYRLLL